MSLAYRSAQAEQMDTECKDFEDYSRCLRDLSRVNVVTFTHRPMLRWLARHADGGERFSVLDVACGHGDALRHIRRRYPAARLEGIDLNPWSTGGVRGHRSSRRNCLPHRRRVRLRSTASVRLYHQLPVHPPPDG